MKRAPIPAALLLILGLVLPGCRSSRNGIRGRVLGPDGLPIPGALVALGPVNRLEAGDPWDSLATARTGPDGRFALARTPGRHGLTATHPLRGTSAPREIRLGPGARMNEDLRLLPGPILEGRTEGGQEGETALVAIRPLPAYARDGEDRVYVTETAGRAFRAQLPPGVYAVAARTASAQAANQWVEVDPGGGRLVLALLPKPSAPPPAVTAWIRSHAVPLATADPGKDLGDLTPLAPWMAGARVVGLGEATHGGREAFRMKHRIFRYLVETRGFRALAFEANLPEARAVDAWVSGGPGDPAEALARMGWAVWETEEVLDLVRWMRAWNQNARTGKRLRFLGIDAQSPTLAYQELATFLARRDPAVRRTLERELGPLATAHRGALAPAEAARIQAAARRLQARLESRPGIPEAQIDHLKVLARFAAMECDGRSGFAGRDRGMADAVLDHLRKEGRVAVWAPNAHIAASPDAFAGLEPMGAHLRRALGAAYRPIGMAFRAGTFTAGDAAFDLAMGPCTVPPHPRGTLDAALDSAGPPLLGLDLRRLPPGGPVPAWFGAPQGTWSIGASFSGKGRDGFICPLRAPLSFDAMIFIRLSEPSRPLAGRS